MVGQYIDKWNSKKLEVNLMANKAYKFRLYPNEEQKILFAKTFGCVRFIYNQMLSDKIAHYKETGMKLNNTPAQYKKEFEWLKEVDSLALANAQMNLQTAYKNFFRTPKVGFPKFKSKKRGKDSYTTNNQNGTVSIIGKKLRLPKVGLVKIVQHRVISDNEKIKSATITRTPSDKYYVSILVEYDKVVPEIELSKDKAIGLDYASHDFYVDSQGREAGYPKFYRKAQAKLAREQRKLANMKYGSNNYHKQKIKVAKVHEKVANQRLDWIHKLSTRLANEYDIVCVEDINMQNMARSLKLGKSTNDNGFGMFRDILSCKLANRGKAFVKIDKWFPSSKMCRYCGSINHELTLSDRVWTCGCGATINRDENAAINIMNEGLRMLFS
jgi:putative transposase